MPILLWLIGKKILCPARRRRFAVTFGAGCSGCVKERDDLRGNAGAKFMRPPALLS